MEVTVVTQENPPALYGLWAESSDRGQARDIPALSKSYYAALGARPGTVLPFYVLSRDYNPATGRFRLFIGGEREAPGLEALALPAGRYGRITVRPKLGLLWGPAIGRAKSYFYEQWLPASGFSARGLEYEYHTEDSTGKRPTVDILFAIET